MDFFSSTSSASRGFRSCADVSVTGGRPASISSSVRCNGGGSLSFSLARGVDERLAALGMARAVSLGARRPSGDASLLSHLTLRRGKKGKAKGGGKKGKKSAAVADVEEGEGEDEDEDADEDADEDVGAEVAFEPAEVEALMDAALLALERDLGKLRTGRAAPGMLESLVVEAYGDHTPLQHLGQVTARNAQTLVVSLYDQSLKAAVCKAITESPLGFNPREENDVVVVPVPEMTKETKKEVAKMAARAGETAKQSVRNARKKALDLVKKAKLPEDDTKRAEKEVQKLHDTFIKKATDLTTAKEKSIVST